MRRQRGFSLIELIFALMVLTIVIMTTLSMFGERGKRLQQAAETILVYQVLANEAELVRRDSFSDLDSLPNDFRSGTDLLEPIKPYKTEITVKGKSLGVKAVTLTIRWNNGQKVAQLTLLRTLTGGSNLW